MAKIDEMIVQMMFNNSQFESEAIKTIGTLDRLKQSTDSLGQNSSSFEPLMAAVDKAQEKFSALDMIATGALLRIGYQAEATAERIVKGLSIDQVTAGWSKYEEKTKSVQTIMSATGDSIDEVNEYLEKLMWYTDETSYNFTDMTNNIGKFTSQGIKLEDATTAMMGISNWAAEAGQGVNEASRAMYNLSQALGMGKVTLRDWMSVENANMGTKQFKEQVIETAIELGTLTEAAADAKGEIVTFANFRDTLQTGWFTNDVLIETLRKYGDYSEEVFKLVQEERISVSKAMAKLGESYEGVGKAAFEAAQVSKTFGDAIEATKDAVSSGWLTTFEHLLGNLETQKVLWTEVTSVLWELFAAGGEARNELLGAWEELGGQMVFLDSIGLILDGILGVMNLIGSAWRRAFPPMTAQTLYDLTVALRDFLASLELTEYASENIADAIGGVLNVFKALGQIIFAVIQGFAPGVSTLNEFAGRVVGVAGAIGRALTRFSEFLTTEEHLQTITSSVTKVVGGLSGIFESLFEAVTGSDFNGDGIVKTFSGVFESIYDAIKNAFSGGADILGIFSDGIGAVFNKILEFLNGTTGNNRVIDFLHSLADVIENLADRAAMGIPIISDLVYIFGTLVDVVANGIGMLLSHMTGTLDWDKVFGLASMLAVLAIMKRFDQLNPIPHVHSIIGGIKDMMDMFNFKQFAEGVETFAKAISIVAVALTMLASLDYERGTFAIMMLALIVAGLKKFIDDVAAMDLADLKKFGGLTGPLFVFSVAIGNLGLVASALAKYDFKALGGSVIALLALMEGVKQFATSFSDVKIGAGTVLAVMSFVMAIDMLVPALAILSLYDFTSLVSGLVALAGVMVELGIFAKTMENVKVNPATAVSLMAIAGAVDLLAIAVAALSLLNLGQIGTGLVAIGGLLLELIAASAILQNVSANPATVATMILMAGAIDMLALAMIALGGLELTEIGTALLAIGGALAEFTIALALLSAIGPQVVAAGAGMALLAASILLLTPAIAVLGALPLENIKNGLIAIAGAVGIFVAAVYLLTPVIGTIAGIAAAFALVEAGAAALVFAFSALSGSLAELAAGIILFGSIGPDTIEQACENIKTILDELVMWLVGAYVKFKAANLVMFAAFIDALVEIGPDLMNGVLSLLNDLLQALINWGPELFQGLLDLLTVLDDYMEPLGEKAVELIGSFLAGLITGLEKGIEDVVNSIIDAGKRLFNSFKNALFGGGKSSIESVGEQMASDAAKGLSTGAARNEKLASRSGSRTAQAYLDGFDETAGRNSPWKTTEERGEEANQGLANGVKKSLFKITDSAKESASTFLSSLGQALMGSKDGKATADGGAVGEVGSNTAQTFSSSVEKSGAGTSAAKSIAKQFKEDNSLEDAAKEQAKKVADAFTTEFNKISSQLSAIGSKFGIAEAYLGPEDEYGQVAKKKELLELQRLQEELQVLGTKYNIAWDQYQNMLANPNISNEEAQKQYADYLKIYEELAKKANEVATKQQDLYGSYQEAEMLVMAELQDLGRAQASLINSAEMQYSEATQEAYNNFLAASTDAQKQYYYDLWNKLKAADAERIFGDVIAKPIDVDQVRNEVYSQLGLDPNNPVASFMSVEDLINQAVSASQQTYLSAVEETYPDIINAYEAKLADSGDEVIEFVESEVSPKFARSGMAMAEATADGIELYATEVSYSAKEMSLDAAANTTSTIPEWVDVGAQMMEGIIQGIEDRRAEVIEAAIQVCLNALNAAKNVLGISSPSKEFLAVGMFAIDGLRIGILNNKESAVKASENVADSVLDAVDPIGDDISQILNGRMRPVIDPEVDLSGVRKAAQTMDSLWSSRVMSAIGDISASELRRREEILDARKPVAPIVENTNNFTQNNYSPKALSDAELYIQTKKELDWAFKGAQG